MKYPNQFHAGCSEVKACKFEKKLDFWGQIWLNNSIEAYNCMLISGSERELIA
jgi:hypothetical protein